MIVYVMDYEYNELHLKFKNNNFQQNIPKNIPLCFINLNMFLDLNYRSIPWVYNNVWLLDFTVVNRANFYSFYDVPYILYGLLLL